METPCGIDPENNMTDIPAAGCRSRSAILFTYIVNTLPRVKKLLRHWEAEACRCQDPELRKQARASLQHKAFHCQGGAVYAVNCRQMQDTVLRLIIAYQTICDYLDNLCDRAVPMKRPLNSCTGLYLTPLPPQALSVITMPFTLTGMTADIS